MTVVRLTSLTNGDGASDSEAITIEATLTANANTSLITNNI